MAKRGQRRIPAAEWLASLIGSVIVLGTIGFLTFEVFQRSEQEPALTVSVLQVRPTGESFVVDVEVRNQSPSAAADVHLAGADRTAAGRQLQVQARLDFVPGFSSRRASLVFESDPGTAPPIRIIGYTRP
jgi:uncharacterized protein (TIGR02588 family)